MAMNPCRCGYLDDLERSCSRAPRCGQNYQSKISGPLYDRVDLFIDVPAVSVKDLSRAADGERSATVAARVLAAREIQAARYKGHTMTTNSTNAHIDGRLLEDVASPDVRGREILDAAVDRFKLSARAYYRVLRVARTIADLAGKVQVEASHIAEALSYRRLTPTMTKRAAE